MATSVEEAPADYKVHVAPAEAKHQYVAAAALHTNVFAVVVVNVIVAYKQLAGIVAVAVAPIVLTELVFNGSATAVAADVIV